MIKIYATPDKEIPKPEWTPTADTDKDEEKYKNDLREYLKKKGYVEPETGYILQFQVGDGYAQYMVISVKQPSLYLLTLGDAWEYPIHKFSKKGFTDEIKMQKKFESLFQK